MANPNRSTPISSSLLASLLQQRWIEAQYALTPLLDTIKPVWRFADTEMLRVPRRYASTIIEGQDCCIQFPEKMLQANHDRADAVIRHEIGHIVDLVLLQTEVDAWALAKGVWLPVTLERRADTLAELIWGQTINYDSEDVQTLGLGVSPRPEELGL